VTTDLYRGGLVQTSARHQQTVIWQLLTAAVSSSSSSSILAWASEVQKNTDELTPNEMFPVYAGQ